MQLQSGGQVLTPSRRSFRRHTALIAKRCNAAGGTSVEIERIAPERGQLPASRMPGSLPTGRLYMTGDLRALTGLPRTHMDFYLREGIVQPTARTGSGYLLFDHAELVRRAGCSVPGHAQIPARRYARTDWAEKQDSRPLAISLLAT